MSDNPDRSGPRPAYCEDCPEEDDKPVCAPTVRQTTPANVSAKRSKPDISKAAKRDEASDSGYSSHAAVPLEEPALPAEPSTFSTRTSGLVSKLTTKLPKRMPGAAKKNPGREPPQKNGSKKSISRKKEKENLRSEQPETREQAARMSVQRPSSQRVNTSPPVQIQHHTRPRLSDPSPPMMPRRPLPTPTQPILIPSARRDSIPTASYRPESYHTVYHASGSYYSQTPTMYMAPQPSLSYVNTPSFPAYPPAAAYMAAPASPSRQNAYYTPTSYEQQPPYFPLQIRQPPQPTQWDYRPPSSRRTSLPPPQPVVDYPMQSPQYQGPHPPQPTHQIGAPLVRRVSQRIDRPPSMASINSFEDALYLEEDPHEFYTRDRQTRHAMLPPPLPPAPRRPHLPHAVTTSSAHPTIHTNGHPHTRNSIELHRSPRKHSLDEPRPPSRQHGSRSAAHSAAHSSSSGHQTPIVEVPSAADRVRRTHTRPRPVSYHGGGGQDLGRFEPAIEAYQAQKTGHSRPIELTADSLNAYRRKPAKTHKSGGSETGSRASSSRDSDIKKKKSSIEKHKGTNGIKEKQDEYTLRVNAGGVKFDVKGGTFNIGRGTEGGMNISVGDSKASKPKENERSPRTYALTSGRPGDVKIEPARSRRRSVSQRPPEEPSYFGGGFLDQFRSLRLEERRRPSQSRHRSKPPRELLAYE